MANRPLFAPVPGFGKTPNPPTPQGVIGQGAATSTVPGPNAFEVAVASYDPDAAVLVVRVKDAEDAEEIEAVIDLTAMSGPGEIVVQLGDNKLAPKISIKVSPRVTPPKFSSIEEAEAWMEANA